LADGDRTAAELTPQPVETSKGHQTRIGINLANSGLVQQTHQPDVAGFHRHPMVPATVDECAEIFKSRTASHLITAPVPPTKPFSS
jgi:hypothetical protein